ncbi:Enoyl-CoA hydratase/carnithine racemase [Rubrobacter radiotolerans]|uniref:Enoyl-CoA hydratase-related protein n=1 Tax=Rubrobacter radiotolerans TaxID=42256 RepID=A0A023X1G3_RUBRA|nr:enoyl-CoA hydratase-related protein [Rubrobacter radiotolerans]AHY45904.1 Enoyl-CoA hydratase/carnithine racemase [Rubrobacter radiotolerans]MDX5893318.1 enoyl-CoA hydratase-related protein [Rubrobacter radiotolerans]SMC03492.1 2-(1,2-epoxy-1,2-dihydrophenyl)acetyl-CoA isomerase [Rubrobacter radiotolerans DSM 5868]
MSETQGKTVEYEKREDGVAVITLNRPKRLNAFNGRMHEELLAALEDAGDDGSVRAVVLAGAGRGFSAGADLSSFTEEVEEDEPDLGRYLRETYSREIVKLVRMEKPVVGALHGPVYGAGFGLALACDVRVAAESAKFSVAFIKIGLMPDAGVSFFLPRVVGLGRAMQMSMTGDPVEAEEAERIGLVSRVVPEEALLDEAISFAARLASLPTKAMGRIKASLYASFESDLETALETEAKGQTFCGYTEDHREGVAAFAEKREPNFTGR